MFSAFFLHLRFFFQILLFFYLFLFIEKTHTQNTNTFFIPILLIYHWNIVGVWEIVWGWWGLLLFGGCTVVGSASPPVSARRWELSDFKGACQGPCRRKRRRAYAALPPSICRRSPSRSWCCTTSRARKAARSELQCMTFYSLMHFVAPPHAPRTPGDDQAMGCTVAQRCNWQPSLVPGRCSLQASISCWVYHNVVCF